MTPGPSLGASGISNWEETPEQNQDTLERFCNLACLGTLNQPPRRTGGDGWEGGVLTPMLRLLLPQSRPGQSAESV